MLDLFGMNKTEEDADAAAAPPAAEPAAPPRGSHRLWALLLVLDAVFVVLFAGAVAAKLYQHWRAPAPRLAARRPVKETPKPAETPAPAPAASADPAPAAAPAPAPEAPKEAPKEAKETASKPAPKAEPARGGMRPPKPSLLVEAPKHREAAKPAGAAAPAASSLAAAGNDRPKAKPVVFRLRSPSAKSVALVGAFIVRGGRKEMSKGGDGLWSAEVYLHPGQYRYFFAVDKKKVLDPENPREERGASILSVP